MYDVDSRRLVKAFRRAEACSRPEDFMRRAGNLIQAVEHPHQPPHAIDPFTFALHDIVQDLLRLGATATQMSRLSQAHRAWLFAVAWQMTNQHHGVIPTVNDYPTIRQRTIGGDIHLALFDFLHAQELHDRDLHDPPVRALTEMMFFLGGMDNDLQSPPAKDAIEENHTIFSALVQEEGIDQREARQRAVAMRDQVTYRFLQLHDQTAVRAGKVLRQYLDCLSHTIRGNLDWGVNVPRYSGTSHRTTR
ncbi:terpene synthase family protein [Streptomyces sp. BHT-5-2]|uniref:terpene synthase family protein n=1 Tax=Streptomyces sp. BHT-5-2 TaxID=2866715 RepID=UPI001C8E7BB2|nr:terpene synthase family protein [Streptomyces sp. BHT-5-2]QZL04849.1 terpene synthase family protein [Streptomyces sp. BHT-5-2]